MRFLIALVAFATLATTGATHADGLFAGLRLDQRSVDYSDAATPWRIDADRTRPALSTGWRFAGGLELAVEHWRADTGVARCGAEGACPAIAVPTRVRLTSLTAGYEWPLAAPMSIAARAGVETGEAVIGDFSRRERSLVAGLTGRYRLADKVSVGLDVAASGFESRSVGLGVRVEF